MFRLALIGVIGVAVAAAAYAALPPKHAEDLANLLEGNPVDFEGDEAKATAICKRVEKLTPPRSDLPTARETASLKQCDGESLYYGIGVPANPERARKCAFANLEVDDGQPYHLHDSEGLLMMIYANGVGAGRNLDVALRYACQLDDSRRAWALRVIDLQERKNKGWQGLDFESCEHITSGLAQGYCAYHQTRLDDQVRHARMAMIGKSWSAQQKKLFEGVYKSGNEYAATLHEMDCFRGTAQSACTEAGANQWMEEFINRIEGISRGHADELEAKTDARRRELAKEAAELKAEEAKQGPVVEDDYWKEVQPFYDENERQTAASRVIFERRLVAFARAAFPTVTSHRIRRIFADM